MSTLTKTAFEAQYVDNTTGTFADNTTQAITAGDMRQFADDIADSLTFSGGLNWTTVQIGNWNMDSTKSVFVTHGLDYKKIRSVSVLIRDDADDEYLPLNTFGDTSETVEGGVELIGASTQTTTIALIRRTGGWFDNTDYDSVGYNRGWITIGYVD